MTSLNLDGPIVTPSRIMHTTGCWFPKDRWRSPFRNLSFRVPVGVHHLRIEVSYLKTSEAALDLGLRRGGLWLGWSGSELTSIDVGDTCASPGYGVGLPPGDYSLILGLHRIPIEGLPYEISIVVANPPTACPSVGEVTQIVKAPPDPWSEHLDAGLGRTWRRGDLHVHSIHSDGAETPLELGWRARASGLDYIAVTDHNTTSAAPELNAAAERTGVAMLLGQELTTDLGYATVVGNASQFDFRQHPEQWLNGVSDGAIFVNHPTRLSGGWQAKTVARFPAAEIWNGSATLSTADPVFRWWTQYGLDTVAVGGSGWHGPHGAITQLGQPTTWLAVQESEYEDAIRTGRVAVSKSPHGPAILRNDDHVLVLAGEDCRVYSLALESDIATGLDANVARLDAVRGPLLLIADDGGVLGFCN